MKNVLRDEIDYDRVILFYGFVLFRLHILVLLLMLLLLLLDLRNNGHFIQLFARKTGNFAQLFANLFNFCNIFTFEHRKAILITFP